MKMDLVTPGIEVGLVTTDLDPMVARHEGFLELEPWMFVADPDGNHIELFGTL